MGSEKGIEMVANQILWAGQFGNFTHRWICYYYHQDCMIPVRRDKHGGIQF